MLAARALSPLQQHYQRRKRRPVHPAAALDISVCTGKVCKKQGSPGVLQFAQSLQLPDVTFTSCGCLSGCGNGPNLVIQQKGRQPEKINHVGTASHLLAVLRLRDVHLDPNLEKATALRVRGNEAAKVEDYATAITYYTQALGSGCDSHKHLALANRSAMNMHMKDYGAALQDAQACVECAPASYHTAYVRLIDAFYALGRMADAQDALRQALEASTAFTDTPEFKAIQYALQKPPAAGHFNISRP